ncbi:hypothetical protein HY450_00120 [Candidatus Pacearchaeota archaeon]|nr:hypothetical protein [Candidatus Pacearchaeota archaeon]
MITFFCGQIKLNYRGDLSAFIESYGEDYKVRVHPTFSGEFLNLTGPGAIVSAPKRVYIGISDKAGCEIDDILKEDRETRAKRENPENKTKRGVLDEIDDKLVVPYFLSNNQNKPERIIIESTATGYKIVEERCNH